MKVIDDFFVILLIYVNYNQSIEAISPTTALKFFCFLDVFCHID